MKVFPDAFRKMGRLILDVKRAREMDKKYAKFQKLCEERGVKPADMLALMIDEYVRQETKMPTKEEYLNMVKEQEKALQEKIRDMKVRDAKTSADARLDDLEILFKVYERVDQLLTNHALKVLDNRIANSMNTMMTVQKSVYDNMMKMMQNVPRVSASVPQLGTGGSEPDPVEQLARNVLLEFGAGLFKGKPKPETGSGKQIPPLPPEIKESQSQGKAAETVDAAKPETSLSILPVIERVKKATTGNGLKEELEI
jgi:ASC-1-like (ASCH) protein